MIDSIRGRLIQKTPTYIVVETHGVGFRLLISLASFEAFGDVGNEISILTYLHVREDTLQLFGFAREEERELFLHLISVTGVGPRSAQSILSGITVEEFKRAVLNQDLDVLTSAPGVGKKTAERLILELREKIGDAKSAWKTMPQIIPNSVGEEAVLALMSLGYKRARAQEKVQRTLQKTPSLTLEELIRRVLREL
ncbi:Holliday junction branch migration protein RuvA [bacterium]|nr:Holliday junction branch migration protein RuvA [bacterium]RQV94357.1 MAG: Holliday junction branch migration protein RuvA [bacterium]